MALNLGNLALKGDFLGVICREMRDLAIFVMLKEDLL